MVGDVRNRWMPVLLRTICTSRRSAVRCTLNTAQGAFAQDVEKRTEVWEVRTPGYEVPVSP